MNFKRILSAAFKPDDFTIRLLGEDQQEHELTFSADLAIQLLPLLLKSMESLAAQHPEAKKALLHRVHSVQAIVDDQNKKGFEILTDGALQFVLTFDQKQLERLNDGMFRLLNGLDDDKGPKVH